MKTFDIGRKGNQNFPIINREKVDDIHARITIDDDGSWILEDLGSVNGTYIVNANGELVQIRKKRITEFTRVVLADTTAMGFSFFPHHLVESDPKNYREEFQYVVRQYENVRRARGEIEEQQKLRRMKLSLLPVVVSCLIGVGLRVVFHDSPNITFLIIGMMSAVTASLNVLVTWYSNKDQSLKVFMQRMQRLVMCPHCGRMLSEYDMSNQICPACKAHA